MRDWRNEAFLRKTRTYDRAQKTADQVRALASSKNWPVDRIDVVCTKAGCLVAVVPKKNAGPKTLLLADLPKSVDEIPIRLAGWPSHDPPRLPDESDGAALERAIEEKGDDTGFALHFSAAPSRSSNPAQKFGPARSYSFTPSTRTFIQPTSAKVLTPSFSTLSPVFNSAPGRLTSLAPKRTDIVAQVTAAKAADAAAATAAAAAAAAAAAPLVVLSQNNPGGGGGGGGGDDGGGGGGGGGDDGGGGGPQPTEDVDVDSQDPGQPDDGDPGGSADYGDQDNPAAYEDQNAASYADPNDPFADRDMRRDGDGDDEGEPRDDSVGVNLRYDSLGMAEIIDSPTRSVSGFLDFLRPPTNDEFVANLEQTKRLKEDENQRVRQKKQIAAQMKVDKEEAKARGISYGELQAIRDENQNNDSAGWEGHMMGAKKNRVRTVYDALGRAEIVDVPQEGQKGGRAEGQKSELEKVVCAAIAQGQNPLEIANRLGKAGVPVMAIKNAINRCQAKYGGAMIRSSSMGGPSGSDVVALRRKLRSIGMDVKPRGDVDQPLVDAVNEIFTGWDDAPKGLRAGDMTQKGLRDHVKKVNELVDKAIGGAQHLEHAEKDDAPESSSGDWWNPLSWSADNPDKRWLKRLGPDGKEQIFAKSNDAGRTYKLTIVPTELTDDDKQALRDANPRRVTWQSKDVPAEYR
jgi:hypothetical protein